MGVVKQPKVRISLPALGWWFFSLIYLAGLGIVVFALGQGLRLQPQESFVGALRVSAAPDVVTLPAGAIIKEVLVTDDDSVAPGQTLVVFDQDALQQSLVRIEDKILLGQFSRSCAMDHTIVQDMTRWEDDVSTEMMANLRLAAQDCVNQQQVGSRGLRRLSQMEKTLTERLRLVEQHVLALQAATLQTDQEGSSTTQDAIKALLAKSELDEALQQLHFQVEAAAEDLRQSQLDRAAGFDAEIANLEAHKDGIAALLSTPRLAARVAGTVGRLRLPPAGVPLADAVAIMEVQPKSTDPFVVHMDVAREVAQLIPAGSTLSLTVSGLDLRDQAGLQAIWYPERLAATPDGAMLRVSLPLTDASKRMLAARQNRLAFATADSAARVQFHLADQAFWPAAIDALGQVFSGISSWS